jgi:cytochrome P450
MYAIHHDPTVYPLPHEYNAFRFSQVREKRRELGQDTSRQKATALTNNHFLAFGAGRHAW